MARQRWKSSWAKIAANAFFRDLLECLLVNEGDEIGRYISGFCFPIGLADTGRPPREQVVVEERTSWVGSGRRQVRKLARRVLC